MMLRRPGPTTRSFSVNISLDLTIIHLLNENITNKPPEPTQLNRCSPEQTLLSLRETGQTLRKQTKSKHANAVVMSTAGRAARRSAKHAPNVGARTTLPECAVPRARSKRSIGMLENTRMIWSKKSVCSTRLRGTRGSLQLK